MKAAPKNDSKNPFVNVAENLFRDTRTDKYYVKVKKNGKQLNRSLKTTVRAIADIRLKAELEKFEGCSEATDLNIRFTALAEQWSALGEHAVTEATRERNDYRLKHLTDFFKDAIVRKITTADCIEWVKLHGSKMAPMSFAKELATLKNIFDYAVDQDIILKNPAKNIKRPKVPKTKIAIPTREQFEALVKEIRFPSKSEKVLLAERCVEEFSDANGEVAWARAFTAHPEWKAVLLKGDPRKCLHRLHSWAYVYKQKKNVVKLEQNAKDGADLVEFLTYSGARVDEGNSSLWRDVNFEPYVMPAFKAPAGTITINGTKSQTSQRTIPMLPPLRDFLKRLHAEKNPKPEDRIIPIKSARKCLQTACKKLGFPIFTHHDFRHLFATTCIEAGVPIPTIAAWLGHNDGGVLAMKTYGHLRQAHSFDMAALVTTFGPKVAGL